MTGADANPYRAAWRGLRGTLILVGLFSAAVNLLMLTGPIFMLQVYDRVLASGSVATLQGLFAIVVVLYAFLGFYDFLRQRLLSRAAHRLDDAVGPHAYRRWVRSGLGGEKSAGRPMHDLAVVRGFLSSPAVPGFFDLPWVPFYLAIVFLVHPWLGVLALGGAGIVTAVALLNQWTTRDAYARAMSMDGAESFFVDQSRRNAEALLPMGMMGAVGDRWRRMHRVGLLTAQDGAERAEGYAAFSKAFRLLLQSSLLGLGGYLAIHGDISAGMIVATSIIAGRALAPIDQVIGQWRGVVRAREAHRRLGDLLEGEGREPQRMMLPAPKGHLKVSGATKFAPRGEERPDRKPILEQISFDLTPGDGLGVIGPSASGKSSLARLLVGAWRAEAGSVSLDGAAIQHWDPAQLGRSIGYLPQKLELMAGTIRDNIARFDPEAKDEDVVAAAKVAGVHDMILSLPKAYETEVDPSGNGPLSGGQVQRIGLARAVYGNPAVVVLDEPNSNLDASGDEALAAAITHLREKGSTVVVMAHRPSAISAVNKVLVLQEGQVSQFGDKAEVLKRATRPVGAARLEMAG